MQQPGFRSLRDALIVSGQSDRFLWSSEVYIGLADLLRGSILNDRLSELSGRSVACLNDDSFASAVTRAEQFCTGSLWFVPFDLDDFGDIPSLVKDCQKTGPNSRAGLFR
jgi:hypothetical protein